jgi:glutaredoxin
MLHAVKVYGVASCTKTQRATNLLQSMGVAYDYFDLAHDRHAAEWVRWQNGGDEARTPTIMIGLRVLIDPSEAVLSAAVIPASRVAPAAPVLAVS